MDCILDMVEYSNERLLKGQPVVGLPGVGLPTSDLLTSGIPTM